MVTGKHTENHIVFLETNFQTKATGLALIR